jgi:hypothetical protein
MIFLLCRTIISEVFVPSFKRKLLAAHNSFPWKILQGTYLFSRFYSAHLSVSSRKQGFCFQNMGGGTKGYEARCGAQLANSPSLA